MCTGHTQLAELKRPEKLLLANPYMQSGFKTSIPLHVIAALHSAAKLVSGMDESNIGREGHGGSNKVCSCAGISTDQ